MILTAQSVAFQSHVPRIHAAEVARARAFLAAASLGRGDAAPSSVPEDEPTVDESGMARFGERRYQFRHAWVGIQARTGRVVYYAGFPTEPQPPSGTDGPRSVPRALTDDEAARVAQRTYNAAGWGGEIEVRSVADLMGNDGGSVEVAYSPTWQGIPYDSCIESIDMDRQTGRVEGFRAVADVPLPPLSRWLGGTPGQARLAALRAVVAWQGRSVSAESPTFPFHLACWHSQVIRPDRPGEFTNGYVYGRYEPAQLAELRAGRDLLVYAGAFLDEAGNTVPVRLDAHTGRVLEMGAPFLPGTSGGARPRPKDAATAVPTAPRPWRVATVQTGWDSWSPPARAALTPIPSPAPATGGKVLLTDGRAAFPATYDAKANLIAIGGKGYRPGPALASLLRRRSKA